MARQPPTAQAVIAAAGSGERLGAGGPKAFVELAGRPLLAWSLAALAAARTIEGILIAVPPGEEEQAAGIAAESGCAGAEVLAGGGSRSESVALAVERVSSEIVAVHDAARPLVAPELVDEVVAALGSRPDAAGVIAAAPLTDTVKRSSKPRMAGGEVKDAAPAVAKTLSREHLWAAQTPQAFRTDALRQALAADPQAVAAASDDAMLLERAGASVLLHPASPWNLKVTTPEDLRVAAVLLAGR